MVLGRWQATIVDDAGNVQDGASIEVRREVSGAPLASVYSDRAGVTPLGNPFTTGSDGFAAFHVAGGAYQIVATKGAFSRTWRYVAVGTMAEQDFSSDPSFNSLAIAGHIDLSETAVPATPGANIGRLFAHDLSGRTHLSMKDATGTIIDLFRGIVSVTDFGAVADADTASPPTNNSTAFQAAVDWCEGLGGGLIRIPSGRYASSPVHITSDNIHIEGDGLGATIVRLIDSPGADQGSLFAFGVEPGFSTTVAIDDVSISNLEIDGNKTNQLQGTSASNGINQGIGAWTVERMRIENVRVYDCDGYGIGLVGTDLAGRSDFILDNVEVFGCLYDGVDVKGGETNKPVRQVFSRVFSHDNGPGVIAGRQAVGIDCRGQWISLYDCHTWGNNDGGIRYRDVHCFEAKAVGCTAIGNTLAGFRVDGAATGITYKFSQCHALDNTTNGFDVSRDTELIGCFASGQVTGLFVRQNAPVVTVIGGRITDNSQDGVTDSAGTVLQLLGATIDANGRDGIRHQGARLSATSCVIKNNGQTTTGRGITLNGANGIDFWSIVGCNITDDQSPKTQTHAIAFSSSPGRGMLWGNDLTGNLTGEITGTPHANTVMDLVGSHRLPLPILTGGTSVNAAAQLQVDSTTRGFLPPRMTTTQRDAIATPPAGLVIYNTTTNVLNFYNGSAWGAV